MSADQNFRPDPSLLEGAKFHDNVTQVYIRTTEDKLRTILMEFKDAYGKVRMWSIPLSLIVSLAMSLVTTSFVDKFGRPAAFWEALFLFLLVLSAAWFVYSIVGAIRCFKASSVDKVIKRIKNEA